MAVESYRILATNPRSSGGEEDFIVRGNSRYYLINPTDEGLFEISYGDRYLGESDSLKGAERFIARGGAQAPVLIANDGGYKMYKYKSPGEMETESPDSPTKKNPAKKKKKKKKKKAGKKKVAKKKSGKKKVAKKKVAKKNPASPAKRNPVNPAKRAVKKKAAKKKAAKKVAKAAAAAKEVKKVSLDAAVRNHVAKTTGKRPSW